MQVDRGEDARGDAAPQKVQELGGALRADDAEEDHGHEHGHDGVDAAEGHAAGRGGQNEDQEPRADAVLLGHRIEEHVEEEGRDQDGE